MSASYNVKLTQIAERDLWSVWDYIAAESEDAADAFIKELEERILRLDQYPERCAFIPEKRDLSLDYRHLLHKRYRAIFKIEGSDVIVLRVLHGAKLLRQSML